mgnify:CR=1 FL=1
MKPKKSRAWHDFYKAEAAFMDSIAASSGCLFAHGEDHLPRYKRASDGDSVRIEPPKHISWVGQTHMPKAEFDMELAKLKALYQAARPDEVKRFPSRFPQYFEHVEQINIIENEAFDSQTVDPKSTFFTVYASSSLLTNPHDLEAYKQVLIEAGFTASIRHEVRKIAGFEMEMVCLNILTPELFKYAEASAIQIRRSSGKAYRGNLRHVGDSSARRINVGFVLVDQDSDVRVVKANPQAPRPHSLALTGTLIELPLPTTYHLYKKA